MSRSIRKTSFFLSFQSSCITRYHGWNHTVVATVSIRGGYEDETDTTDEEQLTGRLVTYKATGELYSLLSDVSRDIRTPKVCTGLEIETEPSVSGLDLLKGASRILKFFVIRWRPRLPDTKPVFARSVWIYLSTVLHGRRCSSSIQPRCPVFTLSRPRSDRGRIKYD